MTPRTPTYLDLRLRAEAKPAASPPGDREQELHRLELELQNDDHKRTQFELERAVERYRELFESAPVAYLTLDMAGRIHSMNRCCSELTGFTKEELVDSRLARLLSPADAAQLHAHLHSVGDAGPEETITVDLRIAQQTTRRVRIRATLATGETHYLIVLSPVAREPYIASVAHDLNNLLQVLHGLFSELNTQVSRTSAHALVQTGIDTIIAGRELAAGLLASERRKAAAPREVSLDAIVAGTIEMLRPLLGSSIHLTMALNAPSARVICDPTELERVILNLAINARDAMRDGGELTIATADLSTARGPRNAMILVRDTGHGMAPEVQRRMFEPYFTTKPDTGTGLGLATCREIVRRMKGNIAVASAPEQGTTLRIELPQVPLGTYLALGTGQIQPATVPSHTILVVEDEVVIRHAIQKHLESQGYRVVVANSAKPALALARAQQIDLAIVDHGLASTVSGDQLVAMLRELQPGLRVVLMSGQTREELDADETFLAKPFSMDELASVVTAVLD